MGQYRLHLSFLDILSLHPFEGGAVSIEAGIPLILVNVMLKNQAALQSYSLNRRQVVAITDLANGTSKTNYANRYRPQGVSLLAHAVDHALHRNDRAEYFDAVSTRLRGKMKKEMLSVGERVSAPTSEKPPPYGEAPASPVRSGRKISS